jgi:UDP-2-acetamido-2,6-beta-L-arabino-hexul-4-ose reductase
MNDVEVILFDKEDSFSVIEQNIKDIDFIFHLAGINRPENTEEFYKGNTDLTKSIIELLKENNLDIPILMTSSIQAVRDNDYGKVKG